MKVILAKLISVLVFLSLCACNTEVIVANERTQVQAVELVAIFNKHGITAYSEPKRAGQNRYNVIVPKRYYNQAIALIHRFGLAGEAEPALNELLSSGSFLPASRSVEAFKLDLALASQVEQALKTLDPVYSAKVVIRQNFLESDQVASGSVVILLKPGATLEPNQIIPVLQKTLPEIKIDQLAITISTKQENSARLLVQAVDGDGETLVNLPLREFIFWKVPEGEFSGIAWFFIVLLLLAAVIFSGLGFFIAYLRYNRAVDDPNFSDSVLLGLGVNEQNTPRKIGK